MKRIWWLFLLFPAALLGVDAGAQDKKPGKISWKKITLDREFRSEGVGVVDVNKDGKLDVIVGDCWYEAPKDPAGEWKRHILRADRKFDLKVYSQSFACFTDDFNGDGWPDVIVIPFPGTPCYWYENPGEKGGLWKEHLLTNAACNETPIYVDLFKTGKKHLVMAWNPQKDDNDIKKGNHNDRGEMCYFLPGKDPTQPWQRISISGPSKPGKMVPSTQQFSHGLGHGDVNGDGRIDIIVPQGWWEQPEKPDGTPWKFHPANISDTCADMYTYDMTGGGKADIISTSAHQYGFWWSEQKDLNSFIRRPLFQPPGELAKLPKDLNLNEDQKKLFDMINKIRIDEESRAPLALHPELTGGAQGLAAFQARGLKGKVAPLGHNYAGKIIKSGTKLIKNADDLKELAQSLTKDEKGNPLPPGAELGIGAGITRNDAVLYAFVIGDPGKFSLPAQTHALHMVDIDGDGLKDFVTGRRWWAHVPRRGGDGGANDPAQLYWFQAKRGKDGIVNFTPHLIDDDSGIGTSFAIADMNGDGLPDIIVANKKGVHVFLQQR
jgi:FG-GAP-like repeat